MREPTVRAQVYKVRVEREDGSLEVFSPWKAFTAEEAEESAWHAASMYKGAAPARRQMAKAELDMDQWDATS